MKENNLNGLQTSISMTLLNKFMFGLSLYLKLLETVLCSSITNQQKGTHVKSISGSPLTLIMVIITPANGHNSILSQHSYTEVWTGKNK